MSVELENHEIGGVGYATLTMDNGDLNFLDLEHCKELVSCLREVYADDRARLVVLRGTGQCFSAGIDLSQHTRDAMPKLLPALHEVIHQLLQLRAFTVAAIHGHCLGGAAELALACDRVVSEENANVGLPEITLGCFPPAAIPLFPSRLPHGRAIGMMMSGKPTPVGELESLGVIDRVVANGKLDEGIQAELDTVSGKSPAILGMVADLVHRELRTGWASRLGTMEREYLERLLPHPDVEEGISAFMEKRSPKWQDPNERPDPLESLK